MIDFPECERFQGQRQRAICRGEALDIEKCNAYRVRWGLPPIGDAGPGSEFKAIASSLWLKNTRDCQCERIRREMDRLGVKGCKRERDRLIGELRASAAEISWLQKIVAAGAALTTGLAFKVDPLDPIPGLFDEAVSRAAEKERPSRMRPRAKKGPCGGCGKGGRVPPPVEPLIAEPLSDVRRNFIMHVWPVSGHGAWQWNLDQVLSRAELFNGRRVVAIATGPGTDRPEAVKEYLKDFTDEFIVAANSKQLREVVTFIPLLDRVKSVATNEVTFCCHAKGVRHKIDADNEGSTLFRWTSAMYETCLDRWEAVHDALQSNAMAGSFKRHGSFKLRNNHAWHYSGTFYWFRNQEVFSRRNWRHVDQKFYGTEAWPGRLFSPEQTACLFFDKTGNLYDLKYWNEQVEPALREWREGAPCHTS